MREKEEEREHKQGEWHAEGEREAGSPLSREPDAGLDPRTLGSRPSRRQMPKQLNYPGTLFLIALIYILHGLLKESSQ